MNWQIKQLVAKLVRQLEDHQLETNLDLMIKDGELSILPESQKYVCEFIKSMEKLVKENKKIIYDQEDDQGVFVTYVLNILFEQQKIYQNVVELLADLKSPNDCILYVFEHIISQTTKPLEYQKIDPERLEQLKSVLSDIWMNQIYFDLEMLFMDKKIVDDPKKTFIIKMADKYCLSWQQLDYIYDLIKVNHDELESIFLSRMLGI
ncbi:hypothetical protein [uncultured Thomasclavelia sp.]|uniref:hypothetical protein n=1 Tax=uncultured Thomasclavelia sp. TaxID=3025759 RepID=UPI0025E7D383|nr:hypothetical protein [uncultured Thomasclavelia sp.]